MSIRGNLITLTRKGRFDIMIHGCNCFNRWESGIAKQIKEVRPEPYLLAKASKLSRNRGRLGQIEVTPIISEMAQYRGQYRIVNAFTQFTESIPNERTISYEALYSCFNNLRTFINNNYEFPFDVRIGYPKIGAGVANGDWNIIKLLINDSLKGYNHTLVEYNG